jgi:hypothetical protein
MVASQASEMRFNSSMIATASPAGMTSKAAPPSPALRQLRRRTSRRRPASEKASSGTAALSPVFWMARPRSTLSGRSSGPNA